MRSSALLSLSLVALLQRSAAKPPTQALMEQLELLKEYHYADYVLRSDPTHDKGIRLGADGARLMFHIAFEAAQYGNTQAVRSMFDSLSHGARVNDCHPDDFRKQLTEEFGVDPLSVEPGSDFMTEEAIDVALKHPRFDGVNSHGPNDLAEMMADHYGRFAAEAAAKSAAAMAEQEAARREREARTFPHEEL